MIPGLSPAQETYINERGGKQSMTPYGFHLLDPHAMFALARILKYGADKYGQDNWRLISVPEHLNHALQHIFAYLAGDTQDEHLEHALCRLHMAVAVALEDKRFADKARAAEAAEQRKEGCV